jgi:predicted RND superfamily exporter protein
MKKFGDTLIRLTLKHSLVIIIIFSLLTLAALALIPRIKMDNSVDAFFDKKSASYLDFQAWKKQFGSDEVIIVAFSDQDIFTVQNLQLIARLTKKFEQVQYVDKVTSLTNVNDIIGSENDFIVQPLVEKIPTGPKELASLKQQALENPLYQKNLISADATTTAIIIELQHRPQASDIYKKKVFTEINQILKSEFPADKKYYLSGTTTIEYYYANYMQEDLKKFLPLILGLVFVILVLSFRGIVGFILPFLVVILSLIWTMAFLYLCGYSINNVTTVIPPIMLSITLLEAVHFVWELIERKNSGEFPGKPDKVLAETMRHLFMPCLLTNITTVIGFFALLVTSVPPIRQLGWVAGIGVFFSLIITFTLLPALIKQFSLLKYLAGKETSHGLRKRTDKILLGLTKFSEKYKIPILAVTAVIIVVAVWATFRIKTETSVLEYFKKTGPVYLATTFIEKHLCGIHMLNVSLKENQTDYFKNPEALRKIDELCAFLKTFPEVDKVSSVLDYLKEINKSFHNEDAGFYKIPESRKLVAQYALLYGGTELDDFVNEKWNWTTVRVRLKEHSTVKLKNIIHKIDGYLAGNFGSKDIAKTVGQTILEVNANEAVTSGQVGSLSLAIILIFGMMFIDFRSISLGLISLTPNLFPLLLNFGLMGLLSIRLDSVTSIVSDIGIGIIVDDTIHFYHSFGEEVKKNGDYQQALYKSFLTKGSPTIITSVILILGFGVVSFSKFVPTYYFGILSSLLIFNAMWSELLLSPALLMLVKPKFPQEKK